MIRRLAGLYAITRPMPDLVERVAAAIRGGAAMVQYRDKSVDPERRLDEARQLRALCAAARIPFIVNDDPMLAKASHADGVHLGPDDADIAHARALLGDDAIIGVTCRDSFDAARRGAAAGADYLAFGAFFPSATKPHAPRATVALLEQARREFDLPLCAIGGITPDNARPLVAAGADLIAVVGGLWDGDDAEAAASAYQVTADAVRKGCRRP